MSDQVLRAAAAQLLGEAGRLVAGVEQLGDGLPNLYVEIVSYDPDFELRDRVILFGTPLAGAPRTSSSTSSTVPWDA